MRSRKASRGDIALGFVLGILILIVGFVVGVRFGPLASLGVLVGGAVVVSLAARTRGGVWRGLVTGLLGAIAAGILFFMICVYVVVQNLG